MQFTVLQCNVVFPHDAQYTIVMQADIITPLPHSAGTSYADKAKAAIYMCQVLKSYLAASSGLYLKSDPALPLILDFLPSQKLQHTPDSLATNCSMR